MRVRSALALVSLTVVGCGEQPPPDRTAELLRCFERQGGERITGTGMLDGVSSEDPQFGTGFWLESIAFDSVDVRASRDDTRQALAFVSRPGTPATLRDLSPAEALRRADTGGIKGMTIVLLPAGEVSDHALNDCAEAVALDQIFP